MEEEKSSFQVALIKTSPPERHNAATPPLPHLTPAVQMTSKRFYLSARLQDSILLAFCRPPPPSTWGTEEAAARERTAVNPRSCFRSHTFRRRAAATTGGPRDNNKETPHINTFCFSLVALKQEGNPLLAFLFLLRESGPFPLPEYHESSAK